ncbi:MAG: UDP-2,3-diacylglucosamine diphosphatase [Pseudorhodobacter sp.]|nr:UDP-2,3-diacylglucosamine diphosphatase [Pseudorhodobacter sp.]
MSTGAAMPLPPSHRFRSLFLSDLHMGAVGCRIDAILAFLRCHSADHIYLVGDILDLWHPLRLVWSEKHEEIIALLRQRVKDGAEVFYLVGNHDAILLNDVARKEVGLDFVSVLTQLTHDAADGRRYLVLHGDAVDARWLRWHFCTRLGSRIDGQLRAFDAWLRRLRGRVVPEEGRSAIAIVLGWVNDLIYAGQAHEQRLVELARQSGHHGVICGHFHIATLHEDHGIIYANCGDWVDSFTALVETDAGTLRLIDGLAATSSSVVEITEAAPQHARASSEGWQ